MGVGKKRTQRTEGIRVTKVEIEGGERGGEWRRGKEKGGDLYSDILIRLLRGKN